MKKVLSLILSFAFGVAALAQTLDKGPWFDHYVNGINRLPTRATSYSFDDQAKALAGDRED